MQVHSRLPLLNLDVLSSLLPHFESSKEVLSFMLVCRDLYAPSIPHLLDPKREGVQLRNGKDALLFIAFMSAASHNYLRVNSLSDLRILIDFNPQSEDFTDAEDPRFIGRQLAEIVHHSPNLEHLKFDDSILDLDDQIFEVFKDLKSLKRLHTLSMHITSESGCRLVEEMEACPILHLSIGFDTNILMGPEVLLPFAPTITTLHVHLPSLFGLRDVCCPRVRELALCTSDDIVTSDLLKAFPVLQDFMLEDDDPVPLPFVDDVTALRRRGDNQSRLIRDRVATMRLRYVRDTSSSLYMMGMLPEVRELDLLQDVNAPAGNLGRAIQVNFLVNILSKFTTLKYLSVRIRYLGHGGPNATILEPHALDAQETKDCVETALNDGFLLTMASDIARGIPSLQQVGIDCLDHNVGPQGFWNVVRRGDLIGTKRAMWLTLVPLDQFSGKRASARFWESTKEMDGGSWKRLPIGRG
ncbi:hypothetical protein NLI96_g8319 [Meripilus lineatus]|uniref:F-box domain-containing protein n=1 Tax=Meripilus lineatus TaxID=2056292 RepID=A0AAD5YB75_9APHY|nr:hypothetical protein NLI96_g8319 [Physisporinus lineatus]